MNAMNSIPRPEYPRPQFVRDGWMNLNGEWQFEIDNGRSGQDRGLVERKMLNSRIIVPFCPESRLSGINNTDFMTCVWYKRTFTLPKEAIHKKVLLHFGAADYLTKVWVNGKFAGVHEGGYTSFSMDITDALTSGENILTVCCEDDVRNPMQPSGKQSEVYQSKGCFYTRTTGIWQTVWLEWMNQAHVSRVLITPDAMNGRVHLKLILHKAVGYEVSVQALYSQRPVGCSTASVASDVIELTIELSERHLWELGNPALYDLNITLQKDGVVCDRLASYFGLRSLGFEGRRFLLNGKPVFQRLVLDQGFYPDGIYTAPTDEDLRKDIELAMKMGFNGARLHQKVFEARYLYWADHMGYLCWGEMGSWGLNHTELTAFPAFCKEWTDVIMRDYSAPCVVGWCPFNETWDVDGRKQNDDVLRLTYRLTKALDQTRPCIDTSGAYHVETDIHDVHDYTQDSQEFRRRYGKGTEAIYERFSDRQRCKPGQPVFVSEYGGIRWSQEEGWGYGKGPETSDEFVKRYKALTDVLLDNPDHFALCYTQLTDVEQEKNGLYTFDRKPKFPAEILYPIMSRKAACEE